MCVFVCSSRVVPCTSWLGVRCGGVCLGPGCCRAPPLLAGVLGRVCVCVGAPLVPYHSWLGCEVWACVLGSGFGCVQHLLAGLLGCVRVFVQVPRLHPFLPGGRLWHWGVQVLLWVGFPPPPSPLVSFFSGRHGVSCRGFVVSVAGCPGPGSGGVRPPFSSRSGCALVCFLFVFFSGQRGV